MRQSPDNDALTKEPRMVRQLGGARRLTFAPALLVLVAACGAVDARTDTTTTVTGPPLVASAAAHGSAEPYTLYTHCGIDEARIASATSRPSSR